MKNSAYLARSLFLVLAAMPAAAQVATNDLFDRPNSGNLGVDWVEQDGDSKIVNNKLEANSPFGFGWCSHTAFQAGYADVVVRASWSMNGLGGDSISMISGADASSWSGTEVRVADNDGDGAADRIFFNAAVNAGAWHTPTSFVNMTTPMTSGEITTWYTNSGDTINVALRDPVTLATQVYSASGILANPPIGGSVGIGYFGNGRIDDFRAWVGTPATPVYTLTTPRSGAPTTMLVTDALPFALIAVAYSVNASGPVFTPFGVLGLASPIEIFLEAFADASGRLELVFPPLGPFTGALLHTQALDALAPALTNYFMILL